MEYKFNETDTHPKLNTPQLLRTIDDSISFVVTTRVSDTDAASSAKYGVFYIVPFSCTLVSVREAHGTKGTDASAVTLNVERLTGTTAKGSGNAILSAGFDLKGAINTVAIKTIDNFDITTTSLNAGDRLALKTSGTLTAVNDVCVTLVFKTDLSNLPI